MEKRKWATMQNLLNQFFIFLGLLGSLLLGALVIQEHSYFIGMLMMMLSIGLISMFIRTLYAFAILLSIILFFAFYHVGISWFMEWDAKQQGMNIGLQSIFTLGAIMAWLSGYAIQKNHHVLQSLYNELALLKRYDENTGILTFNEFVEQAQILFTGMKRRQETGFLVYIHVNERKAYQIRVVKDKLSHAILDSIRIKFDLVGLLDANSLILLLNNTSEQGVKIVMERIQKKLDITGDLYEWEVARIHEEWHGMLAQLEVFKNKGGAS